MDKSFVDLIGNTEQRDLVVALFWSFLDFEGFGIATTRALLPTLDILRWRKKEERKPRSQDFKSTSGQIVSGPAGFIQFCFWKTVANFAAVKSPEILAGDDVDAFSRSDTSFNTSRVDSQLATSYFPFLRNCAAIAIAGTG